MEFTSVETIKQCAALGMGIACLPAIVAGSEIATGTLAALPWSGTDLSMRTLAVWHKDKWLSPAMKAFLSLSTQMFDAEEKLGTCFPGYSLELVSASTAIFTNTFN
jgi:DNA-binding transcriptional LysR family regulator